MISIKSNNILHEGGQFAMVEFVPLKEVPHLSAEEIEFLQFWRPWIAEGYFDPEARDFVVRGKK